MNTKEIIRINYTSLRNEAHIEYHDVVSKLMVKHDLSLLGIEEYYNPYIKVYELEVSILDIVRKSEFTPKIVEQDKVRDSVFRGFSNAVKSAVDHYNPDKRMVAEKISQVVLKSYKNIAQKPFDQQTAAVDDIIRELNDNYLSDIKVLELEDWLVKLKSENEYFRSLMASRYEEMAQRPTLRMVDVRKDVDKLFRAILNYIEAIILSTKTEKYDELIKELNVVSERYKNLLAQSKGKKKTS